MIIRNEGPSVVTITYSIVNRVTLTVLSGKEIMIPSNAINIEGKGVNGEEASLVIMESK